MRPPCVTHENLVTNLETFAQKEWTQLGRLREECADGQRPILKLLAEKYRTPFFAFLLSQGSGIVLDILDSYRDLDLPGGSRTVRGVYRRSTHEYDVHLSNLWCVPLQILHQPVAAWRRYFSLQDR